MEGAIHNAEGANNVLAFLTAPRNSIARFDDGLLPNMSLERVGKRGVPSAAGHRY